MHALDDLGRHAEAAAVGRALLAESDRFLAAGSCRPDVDRDALQQVRAGALTNLGVALGLTGEHAEALRSYARAEAIWRVLDEPEAAAAARANQGIELIALGRASDALRRLDAAAVTFAAAGDRFWHAKCLGHLAEALTSLGRYDDALDALRTARFALQSLGARTEEWRAAIDSASVLLCLGLPDEAEVVLEEIVPRLRLAGVRHDLAAALLVQGTALAGLERRDAAVAALTEAEKLFEAVGNPADRARALLELSRLEPADACGVAGGGAALARATAAAALVDVDRWPGIACLVALRLAELHSADVDVAAARLAEATAVVDRRGLPHLRQALELTRGILRIQQGDLDEGIDFLARSLLQAERIEVGIRDPVLRSAYASGLTRATDHLVRSLIDRARPGDLQRAAARSDRSKAGPLTAVQRGLSSRAKSPHRDLSGEEHQATSLLTELQGAYSALFTSPGPGDEVLRARVATLERRVAAAHALAAYPPVGALPETAANRAATIPVAAALPTEVTSLAYHVLDDEVVAFVTVKGRLTVRRRVTRVRDVLRLLDDLEAHLGAQAVPVLAGQSGRAERLMPACRTVLQRLYLAVLGPVADLLSATSCPRPLVVVPHGVLHRVPFQALHDGRAYLLEDWIISVSPSLDVAAEALARPRRSGPALVLGVADATTPWVEDEAVGVAAAAGTDSVLFVGAEATFARLREHAARARLVHLACHGLFRPTNPAFTSLRLTDRWVRATDVADLDLRGATLVLSACETGRSAEGSGSGPAALAQGLLTAGARSVIVSRWLADDRRTAQLMAGLHQRLAAGDDPPSALRAAQLAVARDDPHPFFWAPFTAVGAPSPSLEAPR
jgi:tetratricopeptide (TPR) repeat protein